MKREFLRHVVMGGLEDMRERLGHWINFYNFQRPHEGIDNATPAERFFQYSKIAREEIERRIRKNERELAFLPPQPNVVVGQGTLGGHPARRDQGQRPVHRPPGRPGGEPDGSRSEKGEER